MGKKLTKKQEFKFFDYPSTRNAKREYLKFYKKNEKLEQKLGMFSNIKLRYQIEKAIFYLHGDKMKELKESHNKKNRYADALWNASSLIAIFKIAEQESKQIIAIEEKKEKSKNET